MPLSEEELRLLEQMERALVAEDPKLASALRGQTMRRNARRRSLVAGIIFLVGVAVLMTGAVMQLTVVGIIGFVVMLGSAYVAISSWHGQPAPESEEGRALASSNTDDTLGLSLIEGGKSRRRRPTRPRRTQRGGSFMERFEERWRRRRDDGGY